MSEEIGFSFAVVPISASLYARCSVGSIAACGYKLWMKQHVDAFCSQNLL